MLKIYRKKDNAFDLKVPGQIKFAGNVCLLRAKLWGAAFHLHNSNLTTLPGNDCGITEMSEGKKPKPYATAVVLLLNRTLESTQIRGPNSKATPTLTRGQ